MNRQEVLCMLANYTYVHGKRHSNIVNILFKGDRRSLELYMINREITKVVRFKKYLSDPVD